MIEVDALLDRCDATPDPFAPQHNATFPDTGELQHPTYASAPVPDPTTDCTYTPAYWLDKTLHDLRALAMLRPNWDSYGSPQIRSDLIAAAETFLLNLEFECVAPPFVVPIHGGAIQLEWHNGTHELEVEFVDPNNLAYLKVVRSHPIDDGAFRSDDIGFTRTLIRWLANA
jgi:hypothetical protein